MKADETRGQRFEPMTEAKQLAWCRRLGVASGLPLGVVVALFQEGRQEQLAKMPAEAPGRPATALRVASASAGAVSRAEKVLGHPRACKETGPASQLSSQDNQEPLEDWPF